MPGRASGATPPVSRPGDTPRLAFRSWRAEDEPLAVVLWGDPRVTEWIDGRGAHDADAVRERLRTELRLEREHGIRYWPIFLHGGEFVGCCGLRPREPERGILELGFHIRSVHRRKGLTTEAARSVIAHAFDRLGASALLAGHHPRNAASRRTLEPGFAWTHDEPYPTTGRLHPSYLLVPS